MTREEFGAAVIEKTDCMYRIAYTLLQSDADCRDAIQDAALRAWEKRHTLKDERYFATWLIRILINACHDIGRRRRRMADLEDLPEPSVPPPDPTLSMALAALPEKLRMPLELHEMEGMTYAEIARTLRVPQTTVVGRIHRAKVQLRKELMV